MSIAPVHRDIEYVVLRVKLLLRTIAVVDVPVEDYDAFALFLGCAGSNGDVVEKTKSGWFGAFGVMTWWTSYAIPALKLIIGAQDVFDRCYSRLD